MSTLTRRSFLKGAGAALVTVAAAPLFIPAERLDFGVPRLISTATMTPAQMQLLWQQQVDRTQALRDGAARVAERTMPMLLVQNEFLMEYGGKLAAGTRIQVDRATSDRWLAYGVAVPDRGHPQYGHRLPPRADPYQRQIQADPMEWQNRFRDADEVGVAIPTFVSRSESRLMGQRMLAELRRSRAAGENIVLSEMS